MLIASMPAGMVFAKVTGNIYYVSTTAGNTSDPQGSETNPFTSFAAAIAALHPGDTLVIKAGSYAEALVLDGLTGTAKAPVTIRGEEGVDVTTAVGKQFKCSMTNRFRKEINNEETN